ncbi:hypothetical protein, partial [Phormidium sp. CCY1219]|uniref:hypothetical protein n=1 Tax=Phormidium sp. CCY1219 TaxID=2886104 RepID=UPI002D1F237B
EIIGEDDPIDEEDPIDDEIIGEDDPIDEEDPIDDEPETEFVFLTERIWNEGENREHLLNAFLQSEDERFDEAIAILQSVALKENPDLTELAEQLSEQVPTLTEALNDSVNETVLQTLEANIVAFSAGEGAADETVADAFTDAIARYGGAGRVGNPVSSIARVGDGYIQEFNFGGAGVGAILYGDGSEEAIFLSGEEWQEFQANGGVLTQGYPAEHQLPEAGDGEGEVIELPTLSDPVVSEDGTEAVNGGQGAIAQPQDIPEIDSDDPAEAIAQPLWGTNWYYDTAGDTMSSARYLSLGQTINERVSSSDYYDFYRFNISDRTRVNVGISGMSADADLR